MRRQLSQTRAAVLQRALRARFVFGGKRKRGHQYSVCHVCGCTYDRACPVGCEWAHKSSEKALCSVCATFVGDIQQYIEDANRVSRASLGRLFDLAAARTEAPARRKKAASEYAVSIGRMVRAARGIMPEVNQ